VGRVTSRPGGLDRLPRPNPTRLAVRVTNDAARQIRGGHPWVFERAMTSLKGSAGGAPGDLAVVFDDERRFMAIGLYDPRSPIRLKILHHGQARSIDEAFWRDRLRTAMARRDALVRSGDTTAYRVVHGENDGFPGLVVDRYGEVAVVKTYSEIWFAHLATVVPILADELEPDCVVLRLSRALLRHVPEGIHEGMALVGTPPRSPVPFLEHGLRFEADVVHGHKTGHFLDQRDNRTRVRSMAKGARVLDVFSCTGGFSVAAAAGGATTVTMVDVSAPALAAARHNLDLNHDRAAVRACRVHTIAGDAFDVMARLAGERARFDLVVVDPPSFAANRASVGRALRAYERLAELAAELVQPGGVLVQASCSSRVDQASFTEAVHAGARRAGARLAELARTGHAVDHPIGFPQGAYLKALFARVERPQTRRRQTSVRAPAW
jgi:23S rRNA (cytosine1962-C5)-methyltransferase